MRIECGVDVDDPARECDDGWCINPNLTMARIQNTSVAAINYQEVLHHPGVLALLGLMWVKQCHKPSPSHQHRYIGGIQTYHSQ
jgi:hypothetical protein